MEDDGMMAKTDQEEMTMDAVLEVVDMLPSRRRARGRH